MRKFKGPKMVKVTVILEEGWLLDDDEEPGDEQFFTKYPGDREWKLSAKFDDYDRSAKGLSQLARSVSRLIRYAKVLDK